MADTIKATLDLNSQIKFGDINYNEECTYALAAHFGITFDNFTACRNTIFVNQALMVYIFHITPS
jgi:hypothetical protein